MKYECDCQILALKGQKLTKFAMKRIFIAFFSLALIFAPTLTFADDTVAICYEGETLGIPEEHLVEYNGATLGECDFSEELTGGNNDLTTICHYPVDAKSIGDTIEVDEDSLVAHQAHGDTLGACEAPVVEGENLPPIFSSFSPPTEAYTCERYYYEVEVEDPENDEISFVIEGPGFMSIDIDTGIIDWTPSPLETTDGPFEVLVGAYDGFNAVDVSFSITVFPGSCEEEEENALPIIEGPAYASTTVGQILEFEVTVSDPDGDDLTLDLNLPSGATYSESSSIFSWTPTEVGTTTAFWSVSDGEASTTLEVALEVFESLVEDENLPPYFINFNPPLETASGESYAYDVEAEDPENDILGFSLIESPVGMTIDELTGQINWISEENQVTSTPYNVIIEVTDGNSSTSTSYEVVVSAPAENPPAGGGGETNSAPVIDAPWYASTTLGDVIEFSVIITDSDGDNLETSARLPEGASFDVVSSTFSWTPSSTGRSAVVFSASDGYVTSSWRTVLEVLGEGYTQSACGDVNQDGIVDGRDVDAHVEYIFRGGEPREGVDYDFNDDGFPDVLDLNLLIDHVYRFGPPLTCDPEEEPPIDGPPVDPPPVIILSGGGGGGGGGGSSGSGGGLVNLPPEFVNFTPATSAVSYEFYSYNAEAVDPENGVLTFSLFDAPNGMSIIPETGIIYWYPLGSEEGGPHTVTVQVSDGINTVSETYEVTVTPGVPPTPPIIGNSEEAASPEEPEGSTDAIDTGSVIVPDNGEPEEDLGLINSTDEENFEKIGLLASIGAWFQDNLFIPILVIVIALILYLIYLAFVKKKKEDEPATIGDTQIGFSD